MEPHKKCGRRTRNSTPCGAAPSPKLSDVRDLMGNPRDGGGPLLLGPEPIYLTGQNLRLGR
jgi:hypothetical protein